MGFVNLGPLKFMLVFMPVGVVNPSPLGFTLKRFMNQSPLEFMPQVA